jgi:Ca-activated chloride channel family protein
MRSEIRLLSLLGAALFTTAALAKDAPVLPNTTEGRLSTRDGKQVVDVPLKHTNVNIKVDGFVAQVEVEQTFQNPYQKKIEALYLFPLPTGAAVNNLEITTGGQTIQGILLDKEQAKLLFQRAKQKGLVAAMLTQKRPNLFVQRVTNIEPGAEIKVKMHYAEALSYEDGSYELVFPMVAGPRYLPKNSKESKDAQELQPTILPPDQRSSHEISLSVSLDAGLSVSDVLSPSHQIDTQKKSDSEYNISLAAGDSIPNKDFILRYEVAKEKPQFALLSHKEPSKDGSFYLLAQPPTAATPQEITPRELIFVLDTSSSMKGEPLAKAKELIRHSLQKMQPDDTFQIVSFDAAASALGGELLANDKDNIKYSLEWLEALEAGGATEVISGLMAALTLPHDPARLRMIVFITDGYIGNEDEILKLVAENSKEARLFSFGVGSAVNRYLLEEMGKMGRGVADVIRPDEDTSNAVNRFYKRIDAPLLTDLRIDWNGLAVKDLSPAQLPDLFLGQPLTLYGHYEGAAKGTITIHAKQAGKEVSFPVEIELPKEKNAPAVASLWAKQKIQELSRAELKQETPELKAEILDLSLQYRVLSRYTAFIAIDPSKITKPGEASTVAVPVEVPDRVLSYEIYGGVTGSGGANAPYMPMPSSPSKIDMAYDSDHIQNPFSGNSRPDEEKAKKKIITDQPQPANLAH